MGHAPRDRAVRFLIVVACLAFASPAAAHVTRGASPSFEPWITLCIAFAGALYAVGLVRLWGRAGVGRGIGVRHARLFAAGLAVLTLSLTGPLDTWSASSFTAHMTQHEILMLGVAPMLASSRALAPFVWALPSRERARLRLLARSAFARGPWRMLRSPIGVTAIPLAIVWLWHAPRLFDLALVDRGVHALQHTSFLGAALCFWWALRAARQ